MKVSIYLCSLLVAALCIALALEIGLNQLLPDNYRGYLIQEGNDEVKWSFGPYEPSRPASGFNTPVKIQKPTDTIRIVSVGASGTEGWLSAKAVFNKYNQKWQPKSLSSYSKVIEFSLNRISDPSSKRVEIINLGIAAYNATDVIRMLKDSLKLKPDLLLIHIGVNEAWTSERARWSSFLDQQAPYLFDEVPYFYTEISYEVFTEIKAGWRTLDVGGNAFSPMALIRSRPKPIVQEPLGRAEGLDDRREHYRRELERLGHFLKKKNIPVLFLVPAQNLSGFQPFGSMAKSGTDNDQINELNKLVIAASAAKETESKQKFIQILDIDDGISEANFQLGKIYLREGDTDKAREHFWKANDRDIILKRPPAAFPEITRTFLKENNFPYLDLTSFFESLSKDGNLGYNWIYDDVHPNRQAQFTLGTEVVKILTSLGMLNTDIYSTDLQKLPTYADYNQWTGFDREAAGSIAYLRAAHNYLAFGRFRQRVQWDPQPDKFLNPIIDYLNTANSYAQTDNSQYFSAALNLFLGQQLEAGQIIENMDCNSSTERASQVNLTMTRNSERLFGQTKPAFKAELHQLLDSKGCAQ